MPAHTAVRGRVEVTQVLSQSAIVKVIEGEAAVNDTIQ